MARWRWHTTRTTVRPTVRAITAAALVVTVLALSSTRASADVTGGTAGCVNPAVGPPTSSSVLGTAFAQPIGSWQAGDVAQPYPLPDGRVLWVLNDSYLRTGGVGPIDKSSRLLRNVAIMQTGNCFEAITDRQPGSTLAPPPTVPTPEALISAFEVPDQHWWWFHGGEVNGSTLQIVVTWMSQVRPPSWAIGFRPTDTYLATYDWRTMTLLSLQPAPDRGVAPVYGFSVTHDDEWTYLYGQADDLVFEQASKDLYLARVPRGHLERAPSYWTGSGWSPVASAAVPVSTAGTWDHRMRVVHLDNRWIGVEKEDDFFGDEILVSEAPVPQGPWVVTQRFPAPNRTNDGSTNTYDAMAMPWLQDGRLVVSWSNNAYDWSRIAANPSLYRPSFATFDLGAPTQSNPVCHADEVGASGVVTPGPTTVFHPVTPQRMLDTRDAGGSRVPAGSTTTIGVARSLGVPADRIAAVVVNVTITQPVGGGYVTAFPTGQAVPTASTVNVDGANETVANLATVRVGAAGSIDLYSSVTTHLVVDISGWYEPAASAAAGRFQPVLPTRVLDSRSGGPTRPGEGGTVVLPLAGGTVVPTGASAVMLTVTGLGSPRSAYVTVWGEGGRPLASNLDVAPGEARANQVVVPLGVDGAVRLYTSSTVDLVVDVAGWYTGPGSPVSASGLFVPIVPTRLFDSRAGAGVPHGGCTATAIAPPGAGATVLNVTLTDGDGAGYATVWPAQAARPLASIVNLDGAGQTRATHSAVAVSADDRASVYLYERGQVVVDETGWFTR